MAVVAHTVRSYAKLASAPILWGAALVAGRIVSADLPAISITWIRFLLVSVFLIPVVYTTERGFPRLSRSEAILILALSLTGVVAFNLFLFTGLRTVTAVRSSVLIAFAPALVALILAVAFREPTGWNTALGILAAFVGAVVTITNGDIAAVLSGGLSVGDLFLLGCVVSWSAYTIIARYAMARLSALTVLAYSSLLGMLLLTPFALRGTIWGEILALDLTGWIGLLFLSFGAAGIAYLWYYEGIRDVGAAGAAVFLNLEPVSAILLGIVLLGERLTVPVLFGAVLVIAGLYLVNRPTGPAA